MYVRHRDKSPYLPECLVRRRVRIGYRCHSPVLITYRRRSADNRFVHPHLNQKSGDCVTRFGMDGHRVGRCPGTTRHDTRSSREGFVLRHRGRAPPRGGCLPRGSSDRSAERSMAVRATLATLPCLGGVGERRYGILLSAVVGSRPATDSCWDKCRVTDVDIADRPTIVVRRGLHGLRATQ